MNGSKSHTNPKTAQKEIGTSGGTPSTIHKGSGKLQITWKGIFGGSAWTFDETTRQYYLSLFLRRQPDLNWANNDLRDAVQNYLRFWLDRGVDGFRRDSMNLMSKHPDLSDGEITRPDEEYQSIER